MSIFWVLPLLVGTVTVLQGTLNRKMGLEMGLGSALALNSVIVLFLGLGLYGGVRAFPGFFPEVFHGEFRFEKVAWWMILPGIFGFCIIAGIPWAISKLGAAKVFVGIVVAQVTVSMLWDTLVDGKPLSWMRLAGALLAIVGVALVSMDNG
ncbi:MAG: DMT family transporter [Myxococcota bacterium]|nr:DMT family transporter [Myxococcota bacterium]